MKFLFFQNNAASTLLGPGPASPQGSAKEAAGGIAGLSAGYYFFSKHSLPVIFLGHLQPESFDAFSELPFFFPPAKERQSKRSPNKYLTPAHGHISCSWILGCSRSGQRSTRNVASPGGACRAGRRSSRCAGGTMTLPCHATGLRPPARWFTASPASSCQCKSTC